MIPEWQTNAVYFSALLPVRFPELWVQLKRILSERQIPIWFLEGTNDIWARDYLPVQVAEENFVQFAYQPDYLRGHAHLLTGPEVGQQISYLKDLFFSDLRLDGGNLVASCHCAILTRKVFLENSSWPRKKLRETLQQLLRVEECIFIPCECGDWIGHADGVLRFLGDHRVVVNDYSRVDPHYGDRLIGILKRHGLEYETLPYLLDRKPTRNGIGSAVGNFVNYLQIGNLVVVPTYGTCQDDVALKKIETLLPQADVVPLPCTELAREGGVLRCISWPLDVSAKPANNFDKNESVD